jgi:hypothetical protein
MQKRRQKQTGADHPLPSIQAPYQQQNKISFAYKIFSLSLLPFYLLPIIPSNWKTVRPDRKPRAPSYQRKSLPRTKFPRQSIQNRNKTLECAHAQRTHIQNTKKFLKKEKKQTKENSEMHVIKDKDENYKPREKL